MESIYTMISFEHKITTLLIFQIYIYDINTLGLITTIPLE